MASSALDLLFRIKADDDASSTVKKLRANIASDVKGIETAGVQSFGKLEQSTISGTTAMGGLAKAIPLVSVALVAVVGAISGAAVGLFNLAKSTAEFGSDIFDASQKTGLHAEALSALKFAADQSGASMQDLEVAVKVFSKTVGDAARGSDEARDKLIRLGVDPKKAIVDLQGALAQAFKTINSAPEGIKQMNASMDAFGSRSGPNMIATIRSFDGNLEELIKKAKELGVTLTDEDAKAADKFGDTLDTISAQVKGLGYTVAREFMPQIQSAMTDVSKFVKENREQFKLWGAQVADAIKIVRDVAESDLAKIIAKLALMALYLPMLNNRALAGTPSVGPTESPFDPQNRMKAGQQASSANAATQPAYDLEQTQKTADEAQKEAEKRAKAASAARLNIMATEEKAAQRIRQNGLDDARRSYDQGLLAREAYVARSQAIEDRYLKTLTDLIAREREELRSQESDPNTLQAKETALDERVNELTRDHEKRKQSIIDSAHEDRLARLQRFNARAEEIARQSDERDLARTEDNEEQKVITHEKAETQRNAIVAAGIMRRRLSLQNELGAASGNADAMADIQHKLDVLGEEAATAKEEHERRKRDAIKATEEEERQRIEHAKENHQILMDMWAEEAAQQDADAQARAARERAEQEAGLGGFVGGLAGLVGSTAEHIQQVGALGTAYENLGQIALNALSGIGQAVGAAVNQWVLLGKVSDVSARKMAAAALASVASQAAAMAVFHFAIGLVALTPWGAALYGPAVLWFKSAALMASIALGAALIGRGVAGNAFQQQGTAGASGGGGGTGARGYEAPTTNVIEQNRNQASRDSHVFIHLEMADHALADAFVRDIRGNGRIGQMVVLKRDI